MCVFGGRVYIRERERMYVYVFVCVILFKETWRWFRPGRLRWETVQFENCDSMKSSVCLLRWRQNSEEGGPAFHFLHGVNRNTSGEQCWSCEQCVFVVNSLRYEQCVWVVNEVFVLWTMCFHCDQYIWVVKEVFVLWIMCFHCDQYICVESSVLLAAYIRSVKRVLPTCAELNPPAPQHS